MLTNVVVVLRTFEHLNRDESKVKRVASHVKLVVIVNLLKHNIKSIHTSL